MTQFSFKGLGATLPFRKEERKELAPQISTADSIYKSNALISHLALARFFNLNYFPHTGNTCSSSLCKIFQHNLVLFEKQAVELLRAASSLKFSQGLGRSSGDSKKCNPLRGMTQTHISMDLKEKQVETWLEIFPSPGLSTCSACVCRGSHGDRDPNSSCSPPPGQALPPLPAGVFQADSDTALTIFSRHLPDII